VNRYSQRLRRLEVSTSPDAPPCPRCGDHLLAAKTFSVSLAEEGERPQQEYCPSCGRQVVFALEFDDRG
jgi:ribosomal protein S27AE